MKINELAMRSIPQNVIDYPNDNTCFLVWNFKEQIPAEKIKTTMFVADPTGNYDRILDFSTALLLGF